MSLRARLAEWNADIFGYVLLIVAIAMLLLWAREQSTGSTIAVAPVMPPCTPTTIGSEIVYHEYESDVYRTWTCVDTGDIAVWVTRDVR